MSSTACCCCCSLTGSRHEDHASFRLAYMALADCLGDTHLELLRKRYEEARWKRCEEAGAIGTEAAQRGGDHNINFREALAVFEEVAPYETDRSADAEPTLHEELLRIERAWATALVHQNMRAVGRRRDAAALRAAWTAAASQHFPFPTAVMLVNAVDTRAIERDRVWQAIVAVNRLAERTMAHGLEELEQRYSHAKSVRRRAIEHQSAALAGGGIVPKESLYRRVRFAARPRKLRPGFSHAVGLGSERMGSSSNRSRRRQAKPTPGSNLDANPDVRAGTSAGAGGAPRIGSLRQLKRQESLRAADAIPDEPSSDGRERRSAGGTKERPPRARSLDSERRSADFARPEPRLPLASADQVRQPHAHSGADPVHTVDPRASREPDSGGLPLASPLPPPMRGSQCGVREAGVEDGLYTHGSHTRAALSRSSSHVSRSRLATPTAALHHVTEIIRV